MERILLISSSVWETVLLRKAEIITPLMFCYTRRYVEISKKKKKKQAESNEWKDLCNEIFLLNYTFIVYYYK